jgi:AcrR family transcriptional regulator
MKNASDYIFRVPELSNTRQKILYTARETILTDGITSLEFKALAKKSGIGRATLYRHFPSPVDLVYALLDTEARFLVAPAYDKARHGFTGSGLEKFEKTLGQFLDASQSYPEFFKLLAIADAQFGPDQSAEAYAERFRDMFAPLFKVSEPVQYLVEGQTDGSVRPDLDAKLGANAAMASVIATILALQVNPRGLRLLHAGYGGHEILREVIHAHCASMAFR